MKHTARRILSNTLPTLLVLLAGAGFVLPALAQNQELQQRVADIKQASTRNKQALAQ
jgi:hypothetical protein